MINSEFVVNWPSGDCLPVLATKISAIDLAEKVNSNIFRAEDDLDWFSGLLIRATEIGAVLVMQHDGNPQKLTVFYADANVDLVRARYEISKVFSLNQEDIFWCRE
jgi:hypothetical protein